MTLKTSEKRPRYHQSDLAMFLKCGRSWEFRYVQGIKTPPKAALTVGSAVDKAVSANLAAKVQSGADLPMDTVLDAYSTAFDARAVETEWGDDKQGEQKDIGVKLVRLHHENVAPLIKPASVQEEFVIETDAGYDLGGTIDATETSGFIVDTKTAKSAYDPEDVHGLQPTLYDFAYEALHKKPAEGFRFDVLIKPTKTLPARYQAVVGKPTEADRLHTFDMIDQVHKAIKAGIALPAPDGSWWCSQKWCGYANICPKFKGRK